MNVLTSLRRISLIHKSTYVFVEFVILHSYHKKYANIFDHFKFKRDFFLRDIRDQRISEY